jgi:hypothetical protein
MQAPVKRKGREIKEGIETGREYNGLGEFRENEDWDR